MCATGRPDSDRSTGYTFPVEYRSCTGRGGPLIIFHVVAWNLESQHCMIVVLHYMGLNYELEIMHIEMTSLFKFSI